MRKLAGLLLACFSLMPTQADAQQSDIELRAGAFVPRSKVQRAGGAEIEFGVAPLLGASYVRVNDAISLAIGLDLAFGTKKTARREAAACPDVVSADCSYEGPRSIVGFIFLGAGRSLGMLAVRGDIGVRSFLEGAETCALQEDSLCRAAQSVPESAAAFAVRPVLRVPFRIGSKTLSVEVSDMLSFYAGDVRHDLASLITIAL